MATEIKNLGTVSKFGTYEYTAYSEGPIIGVVGYVERRGDIVNAKFSRHLTRGTVYSAISAYLASNVGYSVGAMGRYGTSFASHICWIHRYSATGIRFLTDGGTAILEAIDGSADAIGSDLQVTFIAYADIT